jgi:CRP-like cAMP-binding protein
MLAARKLKGLRNLSWLTAPQLTKLALTMSVSAIEKRGIIFDHTDDTDVSAFILLAGMARISCSNRKGQRSLVMMVGPGMIPCLPPPTAGVNYKFRCEAITNCEIGMVGMDALIRISLGAKATDFHRMAHNCMGRWGAVHMRCMNFMSFSLGERLALTLLELSDDFGTPEAQGTRLGVPVRHSDLAQLVGASRPRVTEHLARLERELLVVRQGRQLVVLADKLQNFIGGANRS